MILYQVQYNIYTNNVICLEFYNNNMCIYINMGYIYIYVYYINISIYIYLHIYIYIYYRLVIFKNPTAMAFLQVMFFQEDVTYCSFFIQVYS